MNDCNSNIVVELLFATIIVITPITPTFATGLITDSGFVHPLQGVTTWKEIQHDYIHEDVIPWDIMFKNSTHGWAVSQNKSSFGDGIILYTEDSGLSWSLQYYNETMYLSKIFAYADTIWVTGTGGLLHSFDDGKSWEYILIDDQMTLFSGIFFFNETLGWIGSARGLYRTVDGGMTWNRTESYPYEGRARDIYFATPTNGWIIHSYGIYHTSDGGDSWEKQCELTGWSFSFVSGNEAWAVGDDKLVHMTDGKTWVEQPLPPSRYGRLPYMTDINFMNKTYGWIGALSPQIAHTQNGGIDWYEQSIPGSDRIYALWFYNETLGWATGRDGRIYRTTHADLLETYSWGISNTAIIYGVSFMLIAVVAVSIIFLRFRKRPSAVSPAPELE